MKILYYTWFENSENDMIDALLRIGHSVVKCHIPLKNYEEDREFTINLENIFIQNSCDIFLTFDFFPLISRTAERLRKRYISWVYDMPHLTLFSPAVKGEYTSIFVFDKVLFEEIRKIKPTQLYYLPLPVNVIRLNKMLGELSEEIEYHQEVSFVGSLYENNLYRKINYLPDYLRGYIDGIIESQKKIYGYNFVEEVLNDNVVGMLQEYVHMDMNPEYMVNEKQLYVDMINSEITCRERVELLSSVAQMCSLKLFTGSDDSLVPAAKKGGVISYDEEMPLVFRSSKINIKSIISGIPLRVLDIMGAGGFVISNYQIELAEFFEDGKDIVLFESKDDLLIKVDYFLKHPDERRKYSGSVVKTKI